VEAPVRKGFYAFLTGAFLSILRRIPMKPKKMIVVLFFTIMLSAANFNAAAASVDLELPIQSALDKLKTSTDGAVKIKATTLFSELINYQELAKSEETKGSELHYKNEEALSQLLQQIKEVDAVKVANLETELAQAKSRYQPFLNVTTPLTTLFGRKVKLVTTAAQIARIDLQNKQNALKNAKDTKANTVREIRATVAEINPLKVQVKSAKSTVTLKKTSITAAGKSFNLAVKKGDTKSALDWLTTLSSSSRQIVEQKQAIYTIEQKITAILIRAKAQLPA
jgi:hypothetical protein